MVVTKLRTWLARLEEIVEDVLIILLSIFAIILAVVALSVLSAPVPPETVARGETLIAQIAQLGFLARAQYFVTLLLPWVLIIIGLLIGRELWLLRRRLEGIHFEVVLHRLRAMPARGRPAVAPAKPVRRR